MSKRRGSARRGAIDATCKSLMGYKKCEFPADWDNTDYTTQSNKEHLIGADGTKDTLYCKVGVPIKHGIASKFATKKDQLVLEILTKKFPALKKIVEDACPEKDSMSKHDRIKCQVKTAVQKSPPSFDFDEEICDTDNYA
jgi:hypothetical protein